MRTGAYGAICVIIAIMAAILGGYLLNAQDVTTCETRFTYVTDIAGAFEGETGDVLTTYNPSANVTGWSTSQGFNHGYMDGVNFVEADPNSYFIYGDGSGPSTTESDTITIQSFTEGGVSRWQAVSTAKGVIVDSLHTSTMRIAEPGAIAPAEQLRLIYIFDLVDVLNGYGYTDYETINLAMPIAFPGEWPGIIDSSGLHYHYRTSHHPAYYTYDADPIESATVYGQSAVIAIGESSGPVSTVQVGFSGSFTFQVTGLTAADVSYVDPTKGVMANGDASVYWNNNQRNVATTVVFSTMDLGDAEISFGTQTMALISENNRTQIELEHSGQYWTVWLYEGGYLGEQADLGKWPAVSMTVTEGKLVFRPISSFVEFGNYTVVDAPITLDWDVVGGEDLTGIEVMARELYNPDEMLRMQVVDTVVRIVGGGLYVQNGEFDVLQKLPETLAFKMILGSAAHVGDSLTVSGSSGSVTIPVTETGSFIVGGEAIAFGNAAILWVSSQIGTVTISGTVYPAALYFRGQSFAAGTVWMQTPSGIVELGEVGDDPTVTLDGLWAPAVNFYDGENSAGSHVEYSDITKGVFYWDKAQLLLVMMGASTVLGLIGSYWGYTKSVDWAIIIAVNIGAWMIL